MDPLLTLGFVVLVIIGALVQSITGFAMALIVVGGVAALNLADLAVTAAVASLISLVNTLLALRRSLRFVDLSFTIGILAGMAPMILLGVALLSWLSSDLVTLLKLLLGLLIMAASVLLIWNPRPYAQASGNLSKVLVGCSGGLISGLYGAGGAPLAYFLYRQLLTIEIIRASLLAVFAFSNVFRTVTITAAGQLNQEILLLTGISIPFVLVATLVGTRVASRLPVQAIRSLVFVVLLILGGSLVWQAVFSAGL